MSTAELLDGLNRQQRQALAMRALAEIARQRSAIADQPKFVLPFHLYDKQLAPENDDWRIRLFLAGRFAGKTVSGSAWGAVKAAVGCPGGEGVLVGPTFRDVRQTMVEGPSGILKALGGENGPWVTKYNRSQFEIDLVNGSKILMRSADKLEGIRGMNLSCCLLYTSPSPRDQRGSRMPSSA